MLKALLRKAAIAGILACGLALPFAASAQQAEPGLGQAWPNLPDVSRNPQWHVYVFQLNGIKYIEVADLSGRIVSAIGTANHRYIALPVGAYPQYVSIPHQAALLPRGVASATPTTVYRDSTTTVSVATASNGAVATTAMVSAGCTNPIECNTNITGQ